MTAGGNAISVLGDSSAAGSSTTGGTPAGAGDGTGTGAGDGTGAVTDGDAGTLGGGQLPIDVGLPVTVGGNAISVAGDSGTAGSDTTPTVDRADRDGTDRDRR